MTEGMHITPALAATNLREIALTEQAGEPRALDTDIADRLGMARPTNIRALIEANRAELETFGILHAARAKSGQPRGRGRPTDAFYLNEEQALLVSAISKAPNASAVRAMLIRTFVAWRRGHLAPDGVDMGAIGGMVERILAEQLQELVPALVREQIGSQQHAVVQGVSAGQVLDMAGVRDRKGLRGLARRVSDILRRYHAERGVTVKAGSLGSATAYVFDPATARAWLADGGKQIIERIVSEKRGQAVLRLI